MARRIQEIERAIAKVVVGARKGANLDPGVCLKGKFPVFAMVNDGRDERREGIFRVAWGGCLARPWPCHKGSVREGGWIAGMIKVKMRKNDGRNWEGCTWPCRSRSIASNGTVGEM